MDIPPSWPKRNMTLAAPTSLFHKRNISSDGTSSLLSLRTLHQPAPLGVGRTALSPHLADLLAHPKGLAVLANPPRLLLYHTGAGGEGWTTRSVKPSYLVHLLLEENAEVARLALLQQIPRLLLRRAVKMLR